MTPVGVRDGGAEGALRAAERRFGRGERRLGHPVLVPLRWVPVLGRQVRSAHALAGAAAQVSGAAQRAVGAVGPALAAPQGSGAARVAAMDRVSVAASEALDDLAAIDLGPDVGLVPPLRDARNQLASELADARRTGERLATTTAGVRDFLQGPRRYLLVASNNAEMRAGSGMFLSAGVLEVVDGDIRLGDLEPTGDLQLEGDGVAVPGDHGALWGWANPGREWRNLAMTPQFPTTAEVATRMWATRGGPPVDGVLSLDVRALAALLAATGPIDVDGRRIGRGDVEQLLLHDQYEGLTYDVDRQGLQEERRDRLGEIARAVVAKLQAGDADLPVLAEGIADAAAGRHLLLWASVAAEQKAWEAAGVAGEVGPDALLLSVLNRGGNKLDPFLDVDAEIRSEPQDDGGVRIEVHVRVANLTPEGEPVYVAGPRPDQPEIRAGDYVGLVSLTMPLGATELALGDGRLRQVVGRDGSSQVMATNVQVARGAEERIVYSFVLAEERARSVVVAASARVPATEWTASGRRWSDEAPREIDLRP